MIEFEFEFEFDRSLALAVRCRATLAFRLVVLGVSLASSAGGLSAQPVIEWQEVRRSGVFGAGGVEFESIREAALGTQHIFVGDGKALTIRVFTHDLTPAGSFAREGGGPGELRSIQLMNVVADTLFVFDSKSRRLNWFVDGEYVGGDGPPAGRANEFVHGPERGLARGRRLLRLSTGFFVYEPVVDSIRFLTDYVFERPFVNFAVDRLRATVQRPVPGGTLHAVTQDGAALVLVHGPVPDADGAAPVQVRVVGIAGDTISRFQLNVEATPMIHGEAELARTAERIARWMARDGTPWSRIRDAYLEAVDLPEYQQPFDRLIITAEGDLMLRHGAFARDTAAWTVVTQDGVVRHRFTLPTALEPLAATSDSLWAHTTGEYDEPVLVLLVQTEHDAP